MLAALHVLAVLRSHDWPLSPLLSEYASYLASGEINSEVSRRREVYRSGISTWD